MHIEMSAVNTCQTWEVAPPLLADVSLYQPGMEAKNAQPSHKQLDKSFRMARSTTTIPCLLVLISCSLILVPFAISAARLSPADAKTLKQKECINGVGGRIAVPSFGRYAGGGGSGAAGSRIGSIGGVPSFTDLDHSGPAAANSRYIPGFDDTFVPNPGYEVPRSSGGVSAP